MENTTLYRKAVLMEYASAAAALTAALASFLTGVAAGSSALVAFGLSAVIGAAASGIFVLRFRSVLTAAVGKERFAPLEQSALFGLGVLLFLLALYVMNEAGSRIFYQERSLHGVTALVISCIILLAYAALAIMKFRNAKGQDHVLFRAGASATLAGLLLAGILFIGILSRALFGWWWADQAAALAMVPLILRGGWKAIEESKGGQQEGSRTSRAGS